MATKMKMVCRQVVQQGGGAYLPLCIAHEQAKTWPLPRESYFESGMIGHEEECEDCAAVRMGLDSEHDIDSAHRGGKIRAALVPGVSREEVRLEAVAGGPGNEQWSLATPSGSLEASIDNPAVWGTFKPGTEYIVEIREHVPSRGNR